MSNEAISEEDFSELREENLRLRKELREARIVAERATVAEQLAERLRQQLEGEEHTRRQLESAVRQLRHRQASLERRLQLHRR